MQPTLLLNLLSTWVGMIALAAVGFVLTPYIVRQIGQEQFGVWILITGVAAQISILDLGIKTSITSLAAKYQALGDKKSLNSLISSSSIVLSALAFLGLSVLFAVGFVLPQHFDIPISIRDVAIFAFLLVSIDAALQLATGALEPLIASAERYDLINLINVCRSLISAALVITVLACGGGLVEMACALLTARIVQRLMLALQTRRIFSSLNLSLNSINRGTLSALWRFASWASVLLITGKMVSQIDNLVVGAISGAKAAAIYAIPLYLVEQLRMLASSGNTILIPRFNALYVQAKYQESEELLLKWARFNQLGTLAICIPLLITGSNFIDLWVGKDFAESHLLLSVLVIPYFLILPGMALTNFLYSVERHDLSAKLRLIEAIVNFGLSVILGIKYGPLGVALGTLFPAIILRGIVLPYAVAKIAHIPFAKYANIAFVSCLPLALGHTILMYSLKVFIGADSWPTFLINNALGLFLFSCVIYLFYLDAQEKSYLLRRLRISR